MSTRGANPGDDPAVLIEVFDRRAKDMNERVEAFIKKLEAKKQELGFTHYVRAERLLPDSKIEVAIFPVRDAGRASPPTEASGFSRSSAKARQDVLGLGARRAAPIAAQGPSFRVGSLNVAMNARRA